MYAVGDGVDHYPRTVGYPANGGLAPRTVD